MRKFTILMALVALASFAMAQVQMGHKFESGKNEAKVEKMDRTKTPAAWEVTFDEVTPIWTIGNVTGTSAWTVSDTTPSHGFTSASYGGEVPPLWIYMGWRYVHDYSESGGNFAWIDGISALLGLTTPEVLDAYVQFDDIDLSSVANPKLTFYQNYKALNSAYSFIDFSTDGGATWTSVEVNAEVEGNAYGETFYELVATSYIANQADVSIRFRWQTTTNAIGGYGYGWEFDDVKIVDNPDYDVKLEHARMNFFEYVDYTAEGNADYYHLSSHYGNIPQVQYDSEFALSWFNVAVKNFGNLDVAPEVTVKVFDPEMTEIFTTTLAGISLSTAESDTVDLIETDFALGTSPMVGKYTVAYSIAVPGQEDAQPENNVDTTYFNVTDSYFGHDIDETSAYASPANWLDGGLDGEMFGTDFTFLFEEEITSMDVFINENSTAGTSIIGHIMAYDEGSSDWVPLTSSALTEITTDNLGKWMNLTFTDPFIVDIPDGDDAISLMAAIEFYYGGDDNDIWIGYDPTVPVSFWGVKWKLLAGSNADQWVSITNWSRGGLNIHLNLDGFVMPNESGINTVVANDVQIYPNPTYGTLNISNVEGAQVQIINMMGQVVENIENAQMSNTVDMSKYANGTYFVKVINGSATSTHKVNLMK